MRNPHYEIGSACRRGYARSVDTESLMPYRRAPTCEKRVHLHRFAAQADVFFLEKIFVKNAAKTVARKKRICYNHQVIAARTADVPRDTNRIRPCGQAVKTAPSHGAIPGSIPGKVTIKKMSTHRCAHFFVLTTLLGGSGNPAVRPTPKAAHEAALPPKYSRRRGLGFCLLSFCLR